MSPESEIARQFYDLQVISTLGWGTAIALGWLVHWMSRQMDNGCAQCLHCQRKNKERHASDEARAKATRERLFGREVSAVEDEAVVASEDGSSGDADGGPRREGEEGPRTP